MISYNLCGGRAFWLAIGTLLVFLVFIGNAGAFSDANVSDNLRDNYSDIASSDGDFPDHLLGRPMHTIHPQNAGQFSNPASTENMPVQVAATGDVDITKIGHFGGSTYAVEVSGNYAYTGRWGDFVVFDIRNKMAPVEVGRVETSGIIRDIALAGNYAYVADSDNGLVIVDVTNPGAPTLKSSFNTDGASYGVAVEGNYAYLADYGNGLVIVDVTNPAAPTFEGSYDTAGYYSMGVTVAGNYAYVADSDNGLVIVDVANPAAPTLKGSYNTAGFSWGVALAGNYAYVADDNGLVIVDVTNPAVPTLKGSYDTWFARGVTLAGNYAYVADYGNGLVIIDVSDPSTPTLKSSYYITGYSYEVAVEGNYAYVADDGNGLVIVDVTNPAAPILKGSYDTAGYSFEVAVEGNYAYVADTDNGLVIVDVSNPAAPILKSSYNYYTSMWSEDVEVVENYAYVADSDNGLVIIDVSNPAAPTLKGSYDTAGYSRGVALVGSYAYVADDHNGLVIIDVSNPAAPTLKGTYDTAGWSQGVAVAGNYAYVADYENGLVIIDVSNPAAPILKGSYNISGASYDVAIAGNYAYVADWDKGLVIIDVSNPSVPTLKGSYKTAGYPIGVAVAGNYAYVADDQNGLVIIDISNPAAPTFIGSYDTAGYSYGVALSGNYVYVVDLENGLVILRVDSSEKSRRIAFVSMRDGNEEIYQMNEDGSGQIRLTQNTADDSYPYWSLDAQKMTFSSNRDGNWEVYVMNADGSGQTDLTRNPANDGYAEWSPDGQRIVFVSDRDSSIPLIHDIYTMDVNGNNVIRITDNSVENAHPAWSPDGQKIAFASDRDGYREIYIMNEDGSGLSKITNTIDYDDYPTWSPDGTKIAFASSRDSHDSTKLDIYIMNANGTNVIRLTNNIFDDRHPSWSLDGQKIAFVSDRDGNREIYVMNSDGTGVTRLTNQAGDEQHPVFIGNFVTVCPSGCDYTRIQDAIDASSAGDTIFVYSGTYYENVNVTKKLALRGIGMPVVDARGSGSVITLAADGITLEGFTATGGGSYPNAGIKVISNKNKLSSNNANSNNYNGIVLDRSINNTLVSNNASFNKQNGIWLYSSNNDTLSGNSVWNNLFGIVLGSSSNNKLIGNKANSNTGYGIILDGSSSNTLIDNNASNNRDGIFLELSRNNKIYHNNIIKNINQGRDSTNANLWDNGYPDGGNYWSDYIGADNKKGLNQDQTGSDGIGDTPYSISGNSSVDRYPLMATYTGQPPSPDLTVTSISFSKDNPVEGEPITITATIKNIGNIDINEDISLIFSQQSYYDDLNENERGSKGFISRKNFNGLASGASKDIETIWNSAPINGFIIVDVDLPNTISEINEYNNNKNEKITLVSRSYYRPEVDAYHFFNPNGKNCYGMSDTSILYYENIIPKPVDKMAFSMEVEDPGVLYNINSYQNIGTLYALSIEDKLLFPPIVDAKSEYNFIQEYIKKDGKDHPLISTIKFVTSAGKSISHAIVPYNTYDVTDSIKNVLVYDSNYPGMARVMQFDFNKNEITYEQYNYTSNFYANSRYIETSKPEAETSWIEYAKKVFTKRLLDSMLLHDIKSFMFFSPVHVTIEDQYGRTINDEGTNEIPGASIIEEYNIFVVPKDLDYKININAYDTGEFSFAQAEPSGESISLVSYMDIPIDENTKSELEIKSVNPDYIMDIDKDGDGIVDETKVPDSIESVVVTPSIRFINGTVMDSVNKTPLSGVTVSTNTTLSNTSNATGFYSFAVMAGEYNLTAKFEPTYYANNTITVSTIGSDVVQDIELLKKPMGTITGKVTGTPGIITVVSPNGGEDWKQGTSQIISWASTGNPGNVNIELLKSGVSSTIISNTANDGSHSWTIPSFQTLGNDYKIRITGAINSMITDTSDNNFAISAAPPSITIASPNGGENWRHGTTHTITWSTAGSPGSNVKIELLRSGTLVKTISSSTANDGSYNWAISSTQTVANDYKIRITSTSNSSYNDTSDNNFIIST